MCSSSSGSTPEDKVSMPSAYACLMDWRIRGQVASFSSDQRSRIGHVDTAAAGHWTEVCFSLFLRTLTSA
ncbi:Hypothetical protein BJL86_0695 [Dietzia timorensis]|uniref:Uncharacterized protein n=1 Tax=Dietzia timorensis TaxID=499555 RepID=A0A173LJQ1_9ACTN|nr:Hypothetical protein BJL86_0695 [Dietzia timorensis]